MDQSDGLALRCHVNFHDAGNTRCQANRQYFNSASWPSFHGGLRWRRVSKGGMSALALVLALCVRLLSALLLLSLNVVAEMASLYAHLVLFLCAFTTFGSCHRHSIRRNTALDHEFPVLRRLTTASGNNTNSFADSYVCKFTPDYMVQVGTHSNLVDADYQELTTTGSQSQLQRIHRTSRVDYVLPAVGAI